MARSADQISRDIAQTRGEIDSAVSTLEVQARSNVRRVQNGVLIAAVAGVGLWIVLATIRRLRRD